MPKDNSIDKKELDKEAKEKVTQPRELDLDKSYVVKRKSDTAVTDENPMIEISDKLWDDTEKTLINKINLIIQDRQGFLDKIEEYETAIQGIPEPNRKKPWEGSCELRDTLTATHCRLIETSINQTLGIDPPFIATVKGGTDSKIQAMKLQGLANTAARDFDYPSVLTQISKSTVRSSMAVIIPEWERKVKVEKDVEYYKDINTYKSDYPNAEAAGLSDVDYKKQIQKVKDDIQEKGYHECLYEYDAVIINKPNIIVAKPSDFIMHPYDAANIELAQIVGHKLRKTFNDLKLMEREGKCKNIDRLALLVNSVSTDGDLARQTKLDNKGISSGDTSESYRDKIFTLYKGLIRLDLYDEGIEKDYEFLIVYEENSNCKVLIRLARYAIHSNERNYIVANILPEEDTVFGTCIPELLENPQATLDVMLRLLIDSNSIANVPAFKAAKVDEEALEKDRRKGKFYPGRIFGLKAPQYFESFKADRIDAGAFLNIMRYISEQSEMQDGASRTLAGQALPGDPEAPGVKTAMLMQRSNFMINEYIRNLRPALRKMIRFIIKLYRQNMKFDEKQITVYNPDGLEEVMPINRNDLQFSDEVTFFDVKNQKVEDNMASRQNSAIQDLNLLLRVPIIGENPMAVRALLMNYLTSRDNFSQEEIEQILPTMDQIQNMFRGVAQDVLSAERAGQQAQQLQTEHEQMATRADQQIEQQIKEL